MSNSSEESELKQFDFDDSYVKSTASMYKNTEAIIAKSVMRLENLEETRNENQNFIGFKNVDISHLNDSINSFSVKKTYATGMLDLALIANNFTQMKQLIITKKYSPWHGLEICLMFSICVSLILQIACGIVLVFSTKQKQFIDEERRVVTMKNSNLITLLILVITVINIFINVFLSF
jgi:hypothetical protein